MRNIFEKKNERENEKNSYIFVKFLNYFKYFNSFFFCYLKINE